MKTVIIVIVILYFSNINCQISPQQLPQVCEDPIISLSLSNLSIYPRTSNIWESLVGLTQQTSLDAYVYPQQYNYTNNVNTSQNNTVAVSTDSFDIPARQGINFQFQLGPTGADPTSTIQYASAQLPLNDIFCQGQAASQAFNLQNQNTNGTYLFSSQCTPAVFNQSSCDNVQNINISKIQYQNSSSNMPTFNQTFYVGVVPDQVLAAVFPNNYNLQTDVPNGIGSLVQPAFQQTFNNTPVQFNQQFQLNQRTGIKVCYGIGSEGCCISSNLIQSNINNFKPLDCVEFQFSELNCNSDGKQFTIHSLGQQKGNFTIIGQCSLNTNSITANMF